jgi:O-antigen/teichoic acid export membrane protein
LFNKLKNSELIRNATFLISSNGLAQVVTLLLYPVIARLFTPGEFGQLAIIVSIHSILVTAASGRYEQAIVLPGQDGQASDLFRISLRIAIVVSLLIPPLVFLIRQIGSYFGTDIETGTWFYLLGIMVFSSAYQQIGNAWSIRYKMFGVIAGYTLLLSFSNSLLKLLTGFLKLQDGLLYSFLFAQIITAIYLAVKIRRSRSQHPGTGGMMMTARAYINFPRYSLFTALLNNFSGNLPIYALALYFSEDLTGQFSVALALMFRPVSTYNGSVYQVLMQKLVEMQHAGSSIWPMIRKFILKTLYFSAGPAIILVFLVPLFIKIYIGPNWTEAGRFCQLLVPYTMGALICGPLAFIPNMFNRQLDSLIIDIVYLLIRTGALALGIILKNAYIAVGLYALAGVLVFTYQVLWYRKLLIASDQKAVIKT